MTLTNAHLTLQYEYLTDCVIVLFHADGMNPNGIHAASTIEDALTFCRVAFPFLEVKFVEVEA